VKKGDIVGHVRVLGVLQDLRVENGGKLKEVLIEEGQPIEYGQPVMRFEMQ
jgi:acetyl-CoA carboxylase biotin carboxyl carrier protein